MNDGRSVDGNGAGGVAAAVPLSFIVPALNEADCIEAALHALAPARAAGHEVIVVDGGSTDATAAIAAELADQVLVSPPGRALQMNLGAARARGEVLVFVHADTVLPERGLRVLQQALASGARWGRFDVHLDDPRLAFRFIETLMNKRSRWSGIATGDQAIFVTRALFENVGGYPAIPLMEDIELSRALRRRRRPACLTPRVATSARRWRERGVLRTVVLMWCLRALHALKVSPARLHGLYQRG